MGPEPMRRIVWRSLRFGMLHDSLTGLPNRAALMGSLELALGAGRQTAIAFLDLDRFKVINDSVGHGTGDRVLQAVADRLVATIGDRVVAAERPYGGGSVTIIGFDPTANWIADSDIGEGLWRRLLPPRGTTGPILVDDSQIMSAATQLPSLALPPMY